MKREARVKRFVSSAGLEILAGQDDASNEQVSFRLCRPNDWWFHVRGVPGSHVLLRTPEDGTEPDRESLREAAAVAAWYSKMREGGNVCVSCCQARNVTKPRGAPTGTVSIRNEKKIFVRPALPPGTNPDV